jgi:hypothetical protein
VLAIAAHDDDGIVQAAGDTGPHQATHGVIFKEIFVKRFKPERISATEIKI